MYALSGGPVVRIPGFRSYIEVTLLMCLLMPPHHKFKCWRDHRWGSPSASKSSTAILDSASPLSTYHRDVGGRVAVHPRAYAQ